MTHVVVGHVVKAFGIRGELKLHPTADFWEEVLESERLELRSEGEAGVQSRTIRLERKRPHGRGSYVIKIDGVDDRNAAEALVGSEVVIDQDELDVELPGYLLPFQVVGARVKDEDGHLLGAVRCVIYSAAHDIYEVEGERGDFMVPAVPEIVTDWNEDDRELTIRPLPGLLGDD